MREWFIVGCKLLGLYFAYWAVTSALSSLGFWMSAHSGASSGMSRTEIILTSAFSIIPQIVFALPLLFKTERIADTLKLAGGLRDVSRIHNSSHLRTGITLLGIYIFCTRLGNLAKVYYASRMVSNLSNPFAATQPKGLSLSPAFVDPLVTLAISLFLIFGSKHLAVFLTQEKEGETEQTAPLDRE